MKLYKKSLLFFSLLIPTYSARAVELRDVVLGTAVGIVAVGAAKVVYDKFLRSHTDYEQLYYTQDLQQQAEQSLNNIEIAYQDLLSLPRVTTADIEAHIKQHFCTTPYLTFKKGLTNTHDNLTSAIEELRTCNEDMAERMARICAQENLEPYHSPSNLIEQYKTCMHASTLMIEKVQAMVKKIDMFTVACNGIHELVHEEIMDRLARLENYVYNTHFHYRDKARFRDPFFRDPFYRRRIH